MSNIFKSSRTPVISLVMLVLTALLSGCGSVMTSAPLPQSTLNVQQREQFEGIWVSSSSPSQTYLIAFACDGSARLGGVGWEKEQFVTKQTLLSIALDRPDSVESGFLTIQGEKRKNWAEYLLVRYRMLSQDDLIIWLPVAEPFDRAIKAGRLKGDIYDEVTEITGAPRELLDFLRDPANPPLFDYASPQLFKKVADIGEKTERHGCAKP